MTLTAARTVLTVELDFNAARHLQAEDRAYRIGQTGDVDAHYLYANGTVDGFLAAHINRKDRIFGEAFDGLTEPDYLLNIGRKTQRLRGRGLIMGWNDHIERGLGYVDPGPIFNITDHFATFEDELYVGDVSLLRLLVGL